MEIKKPRFFVTTSERHLLMSMDYMYSLSPDAVLDLLLDFGFKTCLELVRFDDEEANIVEFVQDLEEDNASTQDFETSSEKNYH